ncbi:hypothetical protein STEG23_003565 [Scotinomys teguina]
MKVKIVLSSSVKNRVGLLMGITLKIQITLGEFGVSCLVWSAFEPYQEPSYKELTVAKEPSYKELTAKEPSYRELTAKEPSYRELTAKEPSYRELTAKEPSYRELTAKEPSYKELTAKEPSYRELMQEEFVSFMPQGCQQRDLATRAQFLSVSPVTVGYCQNTLLLAPMEQFH